MPPNKKAKKATYAFVKPPEPTGAPLVGSGSATGSILKGLIPVVVIAAGIGGVAVYAVVNATSAPSPPAMPPSPSSPPQPPLPPQHPPSVHSMEEVACAITPDLASLRTPIGGTQHIIVDLDNDRYSLVSTGQFSTAAGHQRATSSTDSTLLASAGKLLIHAALLQAGVSKTSTVDATCGTGRCSMPQAFYDTFGVGLLTIGDLMNHNTNLPDYVNGDSSVTTMQTFSGNAAFPSSYELNPVMYKIVAEGRAVLDAEKFQLLTDSYTAMASPSYSNTNYLVLQYVLEYVAGSPTWVVFRDDLKISCKTTYDSVTGAAPSGVFDNVASSYWTVDNIEYFDIVRADAARALNPIFHPALMQSAGPSGNIACSVKDMAEFLRRVVHGEVANTNMNDFSTNGFSTVVRVHADASETRFTSMGTHGSGAVEARILVEEGTSNAKYIVVGSYNTYVSGFVSGVLDGVPELLFDCFPSPPPPAPPPDAYGCSEFERRWTLAMTTSKAHFTSEGVASPTHRQLHDYIFSRWCVAVQNESECNNAVSQFGYDFSCWYLESGPATTQQTPCVTGYFQRVVNGAAQWTNGRAGRFALCSWTGSSCINHDDNIVHLPSDHPMFMPPAPFENGGVLYDYATVPMSHQYPNTYSDSVARCDGTGPYAPVLTLP